MTKDNVDTDTIQMGVCESCKKMWDATDLNDESICPDCAEGFSEKDFVDERTIK